MTNPKRQQRRIPGLDSQRVKAALAFVMLLSAAGAATASAQGQSFTVLHAFGGGNDGGAPYAAVIRDDAGNLYGTTSSGSGTSIYGTVFKLDKSGTETILYVFKGGSDGSSPYAGLVRDAAGNLYGTTLFGGNGNCSGYLSGCGTVFKVSKAGKETVLHTFTDGADGAFPQGGLIRDAAGNFYGTAQSGGRFNTNCTAGCGTVFKLTVGSNGKWKETVLHAFTNVPDGAAPTADLITDAAGNFYGTTQGGGAFGYGAVFKMTKSGKVILLHSFRDYPDGRQPYAGLIRDQVGNFYGTTGFGGDYGIGTVFKLTKTGRETVLYSFPVSFGDGYWPVSRLALDPAGNLYGTTNEGGLIDGGSAFGTVFKLGKTGKETLLHSFSDQADGGYPWAGLIRDGAGNLFGTAVDGGNGGGVVFEITP